MLTLKRFRELAESYGGSLRRWPEELRGEAQDLLQVSADARAVLDLARALDLDIETAGAVDDARRRRSGDENTALARLRAGVAARIAAPLPLRHGAGSRLADGHRWLRILRLPIARMAAACACAVAVGLVTGSLSVSGPASDGALTALLQPAPLHFLAD